MQCIPPGSKRFVSVCLFRASSPWFFSPTLLTASFYSHDLRVQCTIRKLTFNCTSFWEFFDLTMVSGCQMQAVAGICAGYGNRAFLRLDINLNIYVAGPFSVDVTGESWDE